MAVLPGRIRLFPPSFPYGLGIAVLAPMVAVALTRGNARWRRLERATLWLSSAVAVAANLGLLAYLVDVMLGRSVEVRGKQLLASSVAVWIIMAAPRAWQFPPFKGRSSTRWKTCAFGSNLPPEPSRSWQ
jgi:hypothetical protein